MLRGGESSASLTQYRDYPKAKQPISLNFSTINLPVKRAKIPLNSKVTTSKILKLSGSQDHPIDTETW